MVCLVCKYKNANETIKCSWFTHCCERGVGCCVSEWAVTWSVGSLLTLASVLIVVFYWCDRPLPQDALLCRFFVYIRTLRWPPRQPRPAASHPACCRGGKGPFHKGVANLEDEDEEVVSVEEGPEGKPGTVTKGTSLPFTEPPRMHAEECPAGGSNVSPTEVLECRCGLSTIPMWSDAEGLGKGKGPFVSVQGINPTH